MALQWKESSEVQKESYMSPEPIDERNVLSKTVAEVMRTEHPRRFVEKVEKWCPNNNSETTGYKRNINKKLNKPEVKKVIEILKNHSKESFNVKELIDWFNAKYLTDGSLQRKILGILVCNGIIKKEKIEYKNKKGETKMIYKFKFIPEWEGISSRKKCCYLINGKCTYDWKKAETTKYFTEKGSNEND